MELCQRLLGELEQLGEEMERLGREGKEPAVEQVTRYDAALRSVQANPVYQEMVSAQANFEKVMAKVNERIFDGMKKGAASPIITLG